MAWNISMINEVTGEKKTVFISESVYKTALELAHVQNPGFTGKGATWVTVAKVEEPKYRTFIVRR